MIKKNGEKNVPSVIESFILPFSISLSFFHFFIFSFSRCPFLSAALSRSFLPSFHPAPSITVFIHACYCSSFHSRRRQTYIVFAFHFVFYSIIWNFNHFFFLVVFSVPLFSVFFILFSQVPANEFCELCNEIYFQECISKIVMLKSHDKKSTTWKMRWPQPTF